MSVITFMLYGIVSASVQGGSSSPGRVAGFDLRVGGLNETELYDLRQIHTTLVPWHDDVQMFGVWSASFGMSRIDRIANWRLSEPPVESVAPYLSRVKSWGYKITFYNSYVEELTSLDSTWNNMPMPMLTYTWILEKDSELRYLSPPPTDPPSKSTESFVQSTNKV